MGRTAKREITSGFVNVLMDITDTDSLTELSTLSGIALTTLRGWAFKRTSPWSTLELAIQLMDATGLSPKELLALLQESEENDPAG